MPHFDGPYHATHVNPSKSSYTLDLPNEPNCFPTFHSSLLHPFVENDNDLFPSWTLAMPGAVVTADGQKEWYVDWILDECHHGCGYQYLVHWWDWGPEEDWWLLGVDLAEALPLDHLTMRKMDTLCCGIFNSLLSFHPVQQSWSPLLLFDTQTSPFKRERNITALLSIQQVSYFDGWTIVFRKRTNITLSCRSMRGLRRRRRCGISRLKDWICSLH